MKAKKYIFMPPGPAYPIRKVEIERAKWIRGINFSPSVMLSESGMRNCMGFIAKLFDDISDGDLLNMGGPSDFFGVDHRGIPLPLLPDLCEKQEGPNHCRASLEWIRELQLVNDDPNLSEPSREAMISDICKRHQFQVNFI